MYIVYNEFIERAIIDWLDDDERKVDFKTIQIL